MTVTIGTTETSDLDREIDEIFGFLSNSETLVLLDSSSIDRETHSEIRFTIVATDTLSQTATADVTVVINDANDETPTITNGGLAQQFHICPFLMYWYLFYIQGE